MTRGLVIASARSGAGKTTVTLGLLAAFRARGVAVRGAKSGPDYIDGAFHAAATGRASVNLDLWAMRPDLVRALATASDGTLATVPDGSFTTVSDGSFTTNSDGELLLVEAAMGLFDGAGVAGPGGSDGSAAALARALGLPVLLVLDVSGQGQSAAAVALGFRMMDPALQVAGVLLNRVASPRHRARVEAAMAACGIPVFGAIGRDPRLALPERHLGLVQAGEHGDLPARLDRLGAALAAAADLDAIAALAATPERPRAPPGIALPPPGARIALARDDAFSFIYPHMITGWRQAGAAILPFSPLADEAPDPTADCVWLPGGYPELHAGRLAAAGRFHAGVRRVAARGGCVHGECGGYMVLGRRLVDAGGTAHAMLDLLGHETSFADRALHLGYRLATLATDSALGARGRIIAGHEFHHATVTDAGADRPVATVTDGDGATLGPQGGVRDRVSGSFFHAIAAV